MKIKTARRSRNIVLELKPRESALPPAGMTDLRLKRILVPVDFSDCSRKAVRYSAAFAKEFNAEVLLLHVVETLPPPPQSFYLETGALGATIREQAAKHLSQWRSEFLSGLSSKAVVRDGIAAHQQIVVAAVFPRGN